MKIIKAVVDKDGTIDHGAIDIYQAVTEVNGEWVPWEYPEDGNRVLEIMAVEVAKKLIFVSRWPVPNVENIRIMGWDLRDDGEIWIKNIPSSHHAGLKEGRLLKVDAFITWNALTIIPVPKS